MKIDHKIETDIGDELELSLANRTSLLILLSWFWSWITEPAIYHRSMLWR